MCFRLRRGRLAVAGAIVLTLAALPRPAAAQIMPTHESVHDACATACQQESDRWTAIANRKLAEKSYYVA